ncbi:MAG TPA: DUF3305 domain-containing protein [Casimicrobiaceae bacterium]|nr:DUF3305 domain-containing protein [Casimicrobiaceae bacterium]
MAMSPARFPVSVVVVCTPLANRWQSERWEPVAVETAQEDSIAAVAAAVPLDVAGKRWRFDGYAIELHRSEGEGYYLNATAPEPKVFVMWRPLEGAPGDPAQPPIRPEVVTVSYNEAARLMDGGERVDGVPMPAEIREWMTPFVAEHYKPEPRRKLRRNDPFADRDAADASRR